uniref:Tyrosine-protein kinase n=1 Tax=Caenorhabditis tropicalis TaxID=1561998 RepID=A0A1I7TF92_9PELO
MSLRLKAQGKQNLNQGNRTIDQSLRSDGPPRKKHQDMDWYHGLLPRADINTLLENDGDFLVRTSHIAGQDTAKTVLSVKWKGKCHHWQLQEKEDGSITIEERKFESVLDMVTTLRMKRLPVSINCPALLLNPINKQDWELRHDQIVLGKMLGEGAFGGVYKAVFYCKGDKKMVAVKVNKGNEKISTRNMIEDVCKEARIMRQYQHPNVVCFYGVCVEREPIMLVMELANQGALDSYLKNEKNNVSLRDKLKYSFDASKGLEYLHQHGCIHRDVAARNFLMHKNVVKITDFGLSKQLSDLAHKYKLKDIQAKLPIRWLAPEVIVTATYTFKSDVYSFGILLWEIFMDGAIPYPGMNLSEVRQKVKTGYRMDAPDRMPTFVRNIMLNMCWPQNPEDRGNMNDIRTAMESVLDGKVGVSNNRSVYYKS